MHIASSPKSNLRDIGGSRVLESQRQIGDIGLEKKKKRKLDLFKEN